MKKWRFIPVHPKLKAKIDAEDFKTLSQHKWRLVTGTTGRRRVVTSIRKGAKVHQVTLGKVLMKPPKGKQVYPRRFNEELDYRKSNLIVCTLQQRQQLLPKNRKKNSSQYRGVSYSEQQKKWRASIEVKGRAISLGSFKNEDDAAIAYNRAARKYFGPHSYQNTTGRKSFKKRKK